MAPQVDRKPPARELSAVGMAPVETAPTRRHYTINEVAEMWNMHPETIRRLFKDEPGVVVLRLGMKRAHGTLRIPEHILERVHKRLAQS